MQNSDLAAEYLEIELTESTVMHDREHTIVVMNTLRDLGLSFSIDDFGMGYSSLNQLKRLPLNKLKIDKSFIEGLPDDPDDLAISAAIIGKGKALKLKLIAEGIETKAQREVLRELGCDGIQGYLVTAPLPSSDFFRFVQKHSLQPMQRTLLSRLSQ